MIEMRKRKKMLELMTGNDMLPYVRYARVSVFSLFFSALVMPFAILSTTLLYIIGPLALLFVLFFNLSFVALGYNYVPTEELLDKEAEESAALTEEDPSLSENISFRFFNFQFISFITYMRVQMTLKRLNSTGDRT